jgi:hypothetical protein
MRTRLLAATAVAVAAVGVLSACSSTSSDATTSAPAASASALPSSAASGDAMDPTAGTPAMVALCKQMVDEKMTPEDATALAEKNNYVARVGTIDGQPQAVTMDLRDDRFTFDVENGVVTGCTYG